MTAEERLVDARGLLCPWPVIRLARAAREIGAPGRIRILADDPAAAGEIASLCAEKGWQLIQDPVDSAACTVVTK